MCFLPTGQLLCGSAHHRLPPSLLDVKRVRDINRSKRAQAAVKCLEFHPTASVALTAGWHKTLDLFQVYTYVYTLSVMLFDGKQCKCDISECAKH